MLQELPPPHLVVQGLFCEVGIVEEGQRLWRHCGVGTAGGTSLHLSAKFHLRPPLVDMASSRNPEIRRLEWTESIILFVKMCKSKNPKKDKSICEKMKKKSIAMFFPTFQFYFPPPSQSGVDAWRNDFFWGLLHPSRGTKHAKPKNPNPRLETRNKVFEKCVGTVVTLPASASNSSMRSLKGLPHPPTIFNTSKAWRHPITPGTACTTQQLVRIYYDNWVTL